MTRKELEQEIEELTAVSLAPILMQMHYDTCLDSMEDGDIEKELDRLLNKIWVCDMVCSYCEIMSGEGGWNHEHLQDLVEIGAAYISDRKESALLYTLSNSRELIALCDNTIITREEDLDHDPIF